MTADELAKTAVFARRMRKAAKDMPGFTAQDRNPKAKEVFRALKKEHPEYSAGKKARIAESVANKSAAEKQADWDTIWKAIQSAGSQGLNTVKNWGANVGNAITGSPTLGSVGKAVTDWTAENPKAYNAALYGLGGAGVGGLLGLGRDLLDDDEKHRSHILPGMLMGGLAGAGGRAAYDYGKEWLNQRKVPEDLEEHLRRIAELAPPGKTIDPETGQLVPITPSPGEPSPRKPGWVHPQNRSYWDRLLYGRLPYRKSIPEPAPKSVLRPGPQKTTSASVKIADDDANLFTGPLAQGIYGAAAMPPLMETAHQIWFNPRASVRREASRLGISPELHSFRQAATTSLMPSMSPKAIPAKDFASLPKTHLFDPVARSPGYVLSVAEPRQGSSGSAATSLREQTIRRIGADPRYGQEVLSALKNVNLTLGTTLPPGPPKMQPSLLPGSPPVRDPGTRTRVSLGGLGRSTITNRWEPPPTLPALLPAEQAASKHFYNVAPGYPIIEARNAAAAKPGLFAKPLNWKAHAAGAAIPPIIALLSALNPSSDMPPEAREELLQHQQEVQKLMLERANEAVRKQQLAAPRSR